MDKEAAVVFDIPRLPDTVVLRWAGMFFPFSRELLTPKMAAGAVVLLRKDEGKFQSMLVAPTDIGDQLFTVTEADIRELGYGTH